MDSRNFFRTLIFLASLCLTTAAQAKLVIAITDTRTGRSQFLDESVKLVADDEVRIVDQDGTLRGDFKLLEFIKAGEMGRVFKATNEKGQLVAVKFPTKRKQSLSYTHAEIKSLEAIKGYEIPTVQVLNYVPGFFVEKEFISGGTLTDTLYHWHNYSVQEKSDRIVGLMEFIRAIRAKPIEIRDLHTGNIIWDEKTRKWKVLDPGSIHKNTGNTNHGEGRFLANIKQYGSADLKETVQFALSNPEWSERYIQLRAQVAKIRSPEDLGEARDFFIAAEPPKDSPLQYRRLWNEGLARLALVHSREHTPQAIECIVEKLKHLP